LFSLFWAEFVLKLEQYEEGRSEIVIINPNCKENNRNILRIFSKDLPMADKYANSSKFFLVGKAKVYFNSYIYGI
jgi:hypothetical protein